MKALCLAMASLLLPACLLTGCGPDLPERSLVGADALASDATLAGETITLWFRKYNDTGTFPTLSYTIRPNGEVEIKLGNDRAVGWFGGVRILATVNSGRARLSADSQVEIRRMLGRLRPQELSSDVPFALPEGCSFIHDGSTWSGVTYSRKDQAGAFLFQHGCEGVGATKVKRLLRSILGALPTVEGSEDLISSD